MLTAVFRRESFGAQSGTRPARPVLELGRKLFRFAPVIYLMISLPTVVFLSTLIPPFQTSDEANHFRRAIQLLRGQIVGQVRSPVEAGGALPKNVMPVAEGFNFMIGHSDERVRPHITATLRRLPWDWKNREYMTFVNTVIYPPIAYLPAISGIWLGRSLGLSILDSFYLGRYFSGVAAVLLATLAIYMSRWGRILFFPLLSLPMTIYQFAALNQDALLIAMSALAFSFYSRAASEGRDALAYESYLSAVLLGFVWAARPPYIFLCLILLSLRRLRSAGASPIRKLLYRIIPFAVAISIGSAWILFGAAPAKVPFRLAEGVSPKHQLHYLLRAPWRMFTIFYNTLNDWFVSHFKQFIGILGTSGVWLPDYFYWLVCAILLFAALAAFVQSWTTDGRQHNKFGLGLLFAGAALVTWAAVYGVEYLTWTKVGANFVDGVQGRYFLPSAMAVAVVMPSLGSLFSAAGRRRSQVAEMIQSCAWIAVTSAAVFMDLVLPHAVLIQYYG